MTPIGRRRRLAQWIHLCPSTPNVSRNSIRIEVNKSLATTANMCHKVSKHYDNKQNKLSNRQTITKTATTTTLSAPLSYNFKSIIVFSTVILIWLLSDSTSIQAAPNPLSLVTRIASVTSPNSHPGQRTSNNNNNNNNSPAPSHLVKSARLATYSLSCPPAASIHPCTCIHHLPDTQIESEEEEVYEISPAITTPYAEPQVRTTTTTTTTTATPLSPLPTRNTNKALESPVNTATTPGPSSSLSSSTTTTTTTVTPPPTTPQAQTSTIRSTPNAPTQSPTTTPAPTPTTTTAPITTTTTTVTTTIEPVAAATITTTTTAAPVTSSIAPDVVETATSSLPTFIAPGARESTGAAPQAILNLASTTTISPPTAATDLIQSSTQSPVPSTTEIPISSGATGPDNRISPSFTINDTKQLAESSLKIESDLVELVSMRTTTTANPSTILATLPSTSAPTIETTTTMQTPLPTTNETTFVKIPEPTATTIDTTTTTTSSSSSSTDTSPDAATSTVSTHAARVDITLETTEPAPAPPQTPALNPIVSNSHDSGTIGIGYKNDLGLQDFAKLMKDSDSEDEANSDTTLARMFPKENALEANPMSPASFAEPLVMTSAASPPPPIASTSTTSDTQEKPFDLIAVATPTTVKPTTIVETMAPSLAATKSTPAPEQASTSSPSLPLASATTTTTTTTLAPMFKYEESTLESTQVTFAPSSASTSSSAETPPPTSATTSKTTSTPDEMLMSTASAQTTSARPTSATMTTALPASPSPSHSTASTTTPDAAAAAAIATTITTTTTTTTTPITTPTTLEPSSTTTTTAAATPPSQITTTTTPTAAPRSTSTTLTTAEATPSTTPATFSSTSVASSTTTATTFASNRDAGVRASAAVTPAPSMKPPMSTTIHGDNGSNSSSNNNNGRRPHHSNHLNQVDGTQIHGGGGVEGARPLLAANSSRAHNERPISAGRAIQSRPLTTTTNSASTEQVDGTTRLSNATPATSAHNHTWHHQHNNHNPNHNHNNHSHQNQQSSVQSAQNGRQILTPNTHRLKPTSGANSLNSSAHHQAAAAGARNQSAAHNHTSGALLGASSPAPPFGQPLSRSTRAAIYAHGNHNQSANSNSARHRPLQANSMARQKQQQQQQQQKQNRHRPTARPDETNESINTSSQRLPGGRRLTRFLAPHQQDSDSSGGGGGGGDSAGVEVVAYCRNIQNPQVLRSAIKGFRGHQVNYFVIDSCRVPPFPNDLFHGIDVRWLEMSNSTVQFHNNFLHGHHYNQHQQEQQQQSKRAATSTVAVY